jgi:hypothetical protein
MAKHNKRHSSRKSRSRKSHTRKTHRKQHGGGDGYFATNEAAPIPTASGAPLEAHTSVSFCGWDNGRVAPAINPTMMSQFGGRRLRRRSQKQRGGGCGSCGSFPPAIQQGGGGCGVVYPPATQRGGVVTQKGGGSGNGGFGFQLDNTLGKVYHSLPVGPCPPVPVANALPQRGGAAVDDYGIVSYKTGYGYNESSPVSTPSAHYLNQISYDRTCGQTGGRRHKRRTHRHRRR